MTTVTLVGYKDNKEDCIRGCLMGTVDSNFFLESYSNLELAAKDYAKRDMEDPYADYEHLHHSWEITVLFDGIEEEHFIYTVNGDYLVEAVAEREQIINEFRALVEKEKNVIKAAREEEKRKAKAAEKKRKEKAKAEAARKKEAKERAELERLKQKYED